jgi:hypothetical protein
MDMKQAIAPTATKSPKPQTPEKIDKAKEVTEGQTSAPVFSQLLQGLQDAEAGTSTPSFGAQAIDLAVPPDAALLTDALQSLPLGLSLESLVGQTQQLDKLDADAALQDGSFLQAKQDAGLLWATAGGLIAGAQPDVAVGQRIATVAAGVQSVWTLALPMALFAIGHGVHQPCSQSGAVGPFPDQAGTASALAGFLLASIAFGIGLWLGATAR